MQSAVQPICDAALKLFPEDTILLVIAVHKHPPEAHGLGGHDYYEIGYGARDPPDEPPAFKEFGEALLAAFMLLLEQFQEKIGAKVVQDSGSDKSDDELS